MNMAVGLVDLCLLSVSLENLVLWGCCGYQERFISQEFKYLRWIEQLAYLEATPSNQFPFLAMGI